MTVELGVTLFQIALGVYVAAMLCYVTFLVSNKPVAGKAGTSLLILGLAPHAASFVVRTAATGHAPFMNLYEYLLSFTLGAVLVYTVTERLTKNRTMGVFFVPMLALFSYLTVRLPSTANPTMPALKSAWLIPHVATAALAYAAFTLAFGLGIMYLIRESSERKTKSVWTSRLPGLDMLDKTTYRTVAFGFLMLTAVLITGAIWAQFAWGKYWSWDPKETWALITWLVYAAYLHTRTTMGWKGRRSAFLAIVGFVATVFTLLGVSYLMGGLHSYA